ncbi:MAG TPA: hypothetical protein VM510_15200 [Caulifigura sp.]|nr:hypothetical protein [Caulifigura sp.]
MFHSHLTVRHLIRELEIKGRPASRLKVPDWLKTFLCDASELFDPASDARAGYECRMTEQGWEASLFLGGSEIVGGAQDGQLKTIAFRFDLQSLFRRFDRVDVVEWTSLPADAEGADNLSVVTVEGVACGEPLRLLVRTTAVERARAGMRRHQDGRVELT